MAAAQITLKIDIQISDALRATLITLGWIPPPDKQVRTVSPVCSNCGQIWTHRACGPTHAMVAAEITAGLAVASP